MKQAIIGVLITSLALLLKSCNSIEPPPDGQAINLKLEDVSCTEAWVTLTTTNLQLPTTVTLKQDGQSRETIHVVTPDTLLYIDALLPNKTYIFIASHSGLSGISSNELSVTTMDTTSHNFSFVSYQFGEHSSSVLYDVAIVNENSIYAVGEIYMNDSLGQPDPKRYNAVVWNGTDWEVRRIPYNYQGTDFYHPIQGVFAFSPQDIWFCGNGVIHWDGNSFIPIPIPNNVWGPYQMNKIWGSSSSDLYVVGNGGNIAWYNGSQWSKIESESDVDIKDIWGISDENGSYNKYLAADNAMFKIDNHELTKIDAESGMVIISIWGISNRLIYTAGDGVVLYKNYKWERIERPDINNIYRIKGQNFNDIGGIGSPGSIIHYFNGYSWQSVNPDPNNRYWRIEIKGNIIVASGYQGEKAANTIMRRN